MPVGGKLEITTFDKNKKIDWFFADINGLVFTWAAMLGGLLILTGLLYETTNIMLLAPFGYLGDLIKEYWGSTWAFGVIIAITFFPPFVLVFVFRYNFTVVGPRRQFGYICRWF